MIKEELITEELSSSKRQLIEEIQNLVMELDQEELSNNEMVKLLRATEEELEDKKTMLRLALSREYQEPDLSSLY